MPEKTYRTRPWTFIQGSGEYYSHHKKKIKIHTPKINTYNNQFEKCQQMYAKLRLEETVNGRPILPRLHTSVEFKSSGGGGGGGGGGRIQHSTKSAPATAFSNRDSYPFPAWQPAEEKKCKIDDEKSVTSVVSDKKRYMDPLRLSQYLNEHGYGLPVMLPSGKEDMFLCSNMRRHLKSRGLPKNPSKREKIKGRARLDYEMANLRALAFCAQQSPKMFRSASANMKNRDVQFVDDEVRDRMHRADDNDADETSSIVVMAINKEELFRRIDTWMDDVERAVKDVT